MACSSCGKKSSMKKSGTRTVLSSSRPSVGTKSNFGSSAVKITFGKKK